MKWLTNSSNCCFIIAIVLNAGNRVSSCGAQPVVLTASSGTIVLPEDDRRSSRKYVVDTPPQKCQWLISAPPGYVMLIIGHAT